MLWGRPCAENKSFTGTFGPSCRRASARVLRTRAERIRYKTNVHTNNKVWLSVLQARRARQPHAKRQASCPSSLSKIADKAEATGFAADRMQALDVPPHRLRDASIALQ